LMTCELEAANGFPVRCPHFDSPMLEFMQNILSIDLAITFIWAPIVRK